MSIRLRELIRNVRRALPRFVGGSVPAAAREPPEHRLCDRGPCSSFLGVYLVLLRRRHLGRHFVDDVDAALEAVDTDDLAGDGWEKTQAAVASRATATDWAEKLLQDFKLDHGQSIATLLPFREIYEGNKRKHLQRIREASGVAYCDMIFFDDYTENLGDAAHLGVMGVHCPRGLTHEHWEGGLRAYARLKAQDTSFMGRMFTLRDLREAD